MSHLESLQERPAGLSARVEQLPQGTRITLRPTGCGRFFVAAFLSFWLCGWAAGEVFALSALLTMLGVPLPLERFFGGASAELDAPIGFRLAVITFLIVWLTFWTFGGMAALSTVLGMIVGRDEFTLMPHAWMLQRRLGLPLRPQVFRPGEVTAIDDRDSGLEARLGSKKVKLTAHGTAADRAWLRRVLIEASGEPHLGVEDEAPAREERLRRRRRPRLEELAASPPDGWELQIQPDMFARLTQTRAARLRQAGCLAAVAIFWNGIVGFFLYHMLGLGGQRSGLPWWAWLVITPHTAIGLAMIAVVIWTLVGSEQWLAGENSLEVRRAFLAFRWRKSLTGASLHLQRFRDSEGAERWSLIVAEAGGEHTLQTGAEAELRALGRVLARETRWELEDDGAPSRDAEEA